MSQEHEHDHFYAYLAVFFCLMILTAATVAVAYVDLGVFNNFVAMGIAIVKGLLVVLIFMHVKESSKVTWLYVSAGFLMLVVFIIIALTDFASRSWYDPPAPWSKIEMERSQRQSSQHGASSHGAATEAHGSQEAATDAHGAAPHGPAPDAAGSQEAGASHGPAAPPEGPAAPPEGPAAPAASHGAPAGGH